MPMLQDYAAFALPFAPERPLGAEKMWELFGRYQNINRQQQVNLLFGSCQDYLPGTCTELAAAFDEFLNGGASGNRMFWIHGNAGGGKSVATAFLVDRYLTHWTLAEPGPTPDSPGPAPLLAVFFWYDFFFETFFSLRIKLLLCLCNICTMASAKRAIRHLAVRSMSSCHGLVNWRPACLSMRLHWSRDTG